MKYIIRIRVFLKPYTWQIFANLVILLTMTGLSLVVPRIIQGVIDNGLLKGQTAFIVSSALLLLGLGLWALYNATWRNGLPRISATICATDSMTTSNTCHSLSTTMRRPVN